ncbi:MAG: glycosyltransferase family 4 protein [Candidatus Woesebacteria bacterium]|nr:MAG: glycosyltransferase family 4 protein [Candidatus Woesebacteria bacterium]
MKEVFANGRRQYPLFQGGDGIAINDLLNGLHSDRQEVVAVGKIDNPDFKETSEQIVDQLLSRGVSVTSSSPERIEYTNPDSYKCVLVKDELFEGDLRTMLSESRPDIVLTQLNLSHRVIDIASSLGLKTVLFVHDHHPFNYLPINESEKISHVFFNSRSTEAHFGPLLKCPSSILYSPLVIDRYKCDKVDPQYITMVNPTSDKGGDILLEVIKAFPGQQFLVVSGWRGVSDEFRNSENVTIVDRQYDMREVYGKTKVLLVPSQWEEGFGRVAVEAMVNRIPVIASNIGGLPEAIGKGGILVNEFINPKQWINSMNIFLRDTALQQRLGDLGYEHALTFDIEKIYAQFIEVLNRIHGVS